MANLITTDISTEVEIVATAGQTTFTYPFPIFESSDLKVYLDDVLTSAYTVTGVGNADGGTIITTAGQLVGTVVSILRDVPVRRYVDLPTSGPLDTDDVDTEFDRQFAIMQQLKSGLARTAQVPLGETGFSFGTPTERADRIFTFDATGEPSFLLTTAFIGATGAAATVTIGTVTTLSPGLAATVTNVGTASAAILDIAIPQGDGAGWTTEQLQDLIAATVVAPAGNGIQVAYDDVTGIHQLSFAGGDVAAGGIPVTKIGSVTTNRLLGRKTAGTGAIEQLSSTQATSMLDTVTIALPGLVPTPVGSKPWAFLRGDLTWDGIEFPFVLACSDETTPITTGTSKVTFRMPFPGALADARASLTADQASGLIFTVDVNKNGVSVLSTKITVDNGERTSVTAVTPKVISDTVFANDDEVTIDVDQVGNGTAKGLKVMLLFRRYA